MLREIVSHKLVAVEPDAKVADVAKLMADRDIGSVLVLTNGRPRGVLTDRDIVVRCVARNLDVNDTTVENILSESLATVTEDDGVYDCIHKMREAKVRRLPVVDKQGRAVGIISFGDLLAMLSEEFNELTESTTRYKRN